MPPPTPTDLIVIGLLATALVVVPSALAYALFGLRRSDRGLPTRPAPARHSRRRQAVSAGRSVPPRTPAAFPRHRFDSHGR